MLDLAWGKRAIAFKLEVRRFFCDVKTCLRKIFTERLPDLVAPSARRTTRLREMLEALAFELGGEAGAAVARWLYCAQVQKLHRRRHLVRHLNLQVQDMARLVRVNRLMLCGSLEAFTARLLALGLSGRIPTAFIERVNLTRPCLPP